MEYIFLEYRAHFIRFIDERPPVLAAAVVESPTAAAATNTLALLLAPTSVHPIPSIHVGPAQSHLWLMLEISKKS